MKNIEKIMGLNELREKFLAFFETKEHLRLPSFSLIPRNDPSLLLINSGMAPLKPYFTGKEEPPSKRVTTCQKCIRTPDIERVGLTSRHGTFFEMLGNFSFGDYFKKEAIVWAWEFVTRVACMPIDKLWVTIYLEDDEAFDIWTKDVGISADRIVRLGKKDNFWEHGTGPCGPCSEIYYDRGVDRGCGQEDCKPGCDCDRYVEFWNNVFTQFYRDEEGNYTKLSQTNIDTGMGLERLACLVQDVNSLFEVDTIRKILDKVCSISGKVYENEEKDDISIRIVTDHIRSTVIMVSDGVVPSNEGRGYVLRRLLRRAARHGRLLGIKGSFLHELAGVVVSESGKAYSELVEKEDYIKKVIKIEEERFEATIDQGLTILEGYFSLLKKENSITVTGEMAFKLHDTYGFPIDLTTEISAENGFKVDRNGFDAEMENQKSQARKAFLERSGSAWSESGKNEIGTGQATVFTGYEELSSQAEVLLLIKEGQIVELLYEGEEGAVILDSTPFYAESGGQAADKGVITMETGMFEVRDVKRNSGGIIIHEGVVSRGSIKSPDLAMALVDSKTRLSTARNHTVTHLLQRALKNSLGQHIQQAGSMVDSERLRFDFTHYTALTEEELTGIENEINERILQAIPVSKKEMSLEEAKKSGATALFDEKYKDTVRVIQIGDYSMELCGGTHIDNTSQAGLAKILGESGIAAGVRRIEALTGHNAISYFKEKERLLDEAASVLKTNSEDIVNKAASVQNLLKDTEKEVQRLQDKIVAMKADELLDNAQMVKDIKVVAARFDQLDAQGLRNSADLIMQKIVSGVVVLGSSLGDKASILVMVSKELIPKGLNAGNIVRQLSAITGGGGGGKPEMAMAGGKDTSKLDQALKKAAQIVESML